MLIKGRGSYGMHARHAQRIRIETHVKKPGVVSCMFKGFHFGSILESGGCSVKQCNTEHDLDIEANAGLHATNDNLTFF